MSDKNGNPSSFSQWIARPQSLIALSALLLSGCGVFIAVYEAVLVRRQQQASVWPYVEVEASVTRQRVEVRVQNTGVGPARVRAAAVTRDGEAARDWEDLIRRLDTEPRLSGWYVSRTHGRVLPRDSNGETIFRLTVEDGASAPSVVAKLGGEILEGRIDVVVCYCSVFDECWLSMMQDVMKRTSGLTGVPEERPVGSCDSAPRSGI